MTLEPSMQPITSLVSTRTTTSTGSVPSNSNSNSNSIHEEDFMTTATTAMAEQVAATFASLSEEVPLSSQESERNRRLAARIRITPCIYLKCTPERQQDEQLALAALLGMDQHTHRREEVMSAVVFHCPSLFTNSTASLLLELFLHGNVYGVEDIVMRMCTTIAWDRDLAMVAIHRTPLTFRYLPKCLQTDLEVIHKLLDNPSGGLYLGQCAPRALLISHSELVLRALTCGFSRSDIPLELLMSKEFIVQAVAVDSYILTECSLGMISDWDVLMAAATGNHCNGLSLVESSLRKCRINPKRVVTPFAEHVKARLDRHAAFQTFLSGISIQQRPTRTTTATSIPLQALNCGEETSTALKRHIAEYVGDVIDHHELIKYQKAWKHQVAQYYHTNIRAEDGSLIIPNNYNSYHYDPEEDMDSLLPIGRFLRWGGGLTLDARPNVPNATAAAAAASSNSSRRKQKRRGGRHRGRGLRVLRHVQIALGMKDASDRYSDASDSSSESESDNDDALNYLAPPPPPRRR